MQVAGAGLEALPDSPGNTEISQEGEAEPEVVDALAGFDDSRLTEVIDRWRDLPETVKQEGSAA